MPKIFRSSDKLEVGLLPSGELELEQDIHSESDDEQTTYIYHHAFVEKQILSQSHPPVRQKV